MDISLRTLILLFGVASAFLSAVLVAVRVIECVYELRKNPDLDTWGEVKQVIKNFFTIEKYGA